MSNLTNIAGLYSKLLEEHGRPRQNYRLCFFQPYRSKTDFVFRIISIFTAPIFNLFLILPSTFIGLFYLSKSLLHLALLETQKSRFESKVFLLTLAVSTLLLGSGVTSPFVNFIDFVGSAFNQVILHWFKEATAETAISSQFA